MVWLGIEMTTDTICRRFRRDMDLPWISHSPWPFLTSSLTGFCSMSRYSLARKTPHRYSLARKTLTVREIFWIPLYYFCPQHVMQDFFSNILVELCRVNVMLFDHFWLDSSRFFDTIHFIGFSISQPPSSFPTVVLIVSVAADWYNLACF